MYEPITSPISPSDDPVAGVSRAASTASTMTSHTTAQFFKAVYLDSPYTGRGLEIERIVGATKPLRIRKRSGVAAAARQHVVRSGTNPHRRHRSTFSFPRSPTSPRAHLSPSRPSLGRQDTTTSYSSAHRAISQLFLNAPLSPASSPPAIPRHAPLPALKRGKHRSSLYLNLGRYETAISPLGLSPPSSASPSPHRSNYYHQYYTGTKAYRSKPLPIPPMPTTPTRAPRKAAKLLGADVPLSAKAASKAEKKALMGKHFRPLPGSTIAEIDKFFGQVPRKSKAPFHRGGHSDAQGNASTGEIGGGRTVQHRDETGRMWMDVEEEQEFAWLLSDAKTHPTDRRATPDLIHDLASSEDDKWSEDAFDMERFTSVLSLPPKPKSKGTSSKADKILGITRGRVEESYLDLGMDGPLPSIKRGLQPVAPRKRLPSAESILPWTRPLPPPVSSTWTPAFKKDNDQGDKEKKRPPPLTLLPAGRRKYLPILTPTTPPGATCSTNASPRAPPAIKIPQLPRLTTPPCVAVTRRVPSDPIVPKGITAPTTPFLHPRKAPVPAAAPPMPELRLANVPIVKKPSLSAFSNIDLPVLGAAPRPSTESSWTDEEEQVSWFEPVTPVEAQGEGFRLINAGHSRKISGSGVAWFEKIRKVSGRV